MRRFTTFVLISTFIAFAARANADDKKPAAAKKPAAKAKAPAHVMMTPADLKWGDAPPSLPPGAKFVVLNGDPTKTGLCAMRLRMPDGYKIAPHWHPKRENVTVISGTLKVGMGDKFDESKMMSFATNSFAYLDPSMHHYAMSSGDTVVQIHGMAPAKFNYINPSDDPSKKK